MIKVISLIGGGVKSQNIVNSRWVHCMNPILNTSNDYESLDNSQCFFLDLIETDTEWRLFYEGANTQAYVYPPDMQSYANNDVTFLAVKQKNNDVTNGWVKHLGADGKPSPVIKPSFINGRFDKAQVWIKSILVENGVWKAWYLGDDGSPTFAYRVGYATSSDDGETWTKYSTSAIYEDSDTTLSRGIPMFRIINDSGNYIMLYQDIKPNIEGLYMAESNDGISWTRTNAGILANLNYGWLCDFQRINDLYYIWIQKDFTIPTNFGPAKEIRVLSSSNLIDWTDLGAQVSIHGSNEFGIGNMSRIFQKPDGSFAMCFTSYKARAQAEAGDMTGPIVYELSQCIKIAESPAIITNSAQTVQYPSHIVFHSPLGGVYKLSEEISRVPGTSNSTPSYAELFFTKLNGSQTLIFANSGVITGTNFGVKMRVEIKTTGTFELFKIGDDVLLTLESGKLRVRLSSDGAGYEKDYITTVNISKPVGLDYIDNHIYVGFTWIGGVLTLYNDFVPFDDSTEITKTVNDSLTTVNNSGSNILIGQNAAIELRSVSVLSGITEQEFIELDI